MTRQQLEHVLRAAAAIADANSFVIVGSQAVLLLFPNPPAELLVSREVDLYPAMHPERSDLIDGAIGALSSFDETFGYYADGVGPETATMPADRMDRATLHYIGDLTAICPDIHDLAVSKCPAGREKDADYVRVLLRTGMVDAATRETRIGMLDRARSAVPTIIAWARRRAAEAAA